MTQSNLIFDSGFDLDFFDLFRLFVVSGALCLIGANTAFWIHAPKIFPTENIKVWRLFFIGKSLITGSMSLLIWARVEEGSPLSLAAWVGMLGVVLTNLSLLLLYRSGKITVHIKGDKDAGSDDN